MRTRPLLPLFGALAMVVPMLVAAQTPPVEAPPTASYKQNSIPLIPNLKPSDPNWGVMYFNSSIGSFKIIGPGKDLPRGNVTIQCHGSVLISGLEGTVTPTNMRQEINDTKLGKQVYFGRGKIVIKGKFKNIQFFGRDLKGVWDGFGIIRLYGEFDKDLETGLLWYASQPEKIDWGNSGMTRTNPPAKPRNAPAGPAGGPKIRVRDQA